MIFKFQTAPVFSQNQPIASIHIGVKYDWPKITLWSIVALGILLRGFHFFDNRSFWLDEMYISFSTLKMDFFQLASEPLYYQQKAPIGYLWSVKMCVVLFGKSEMAHRLFPLICGIASLFAFLAVARTYLKPVGVIMAMGILAMAPPLVYHSVEAKQYSTELLASTVALLLYIHHHKKTGLNSRLLWGVLGSIIIWFSYSSIFILAGMASGISVYFLVKKDWKNLSRYLLPFSMWMVSFGINYFFLTDKYSDQEWLKRWFEVRGGFMPLLPTSLDDVYWLIRRPFSLLHFPIGLSWLNPQEFQNNKPILFLFRANLPHLLFLICGLILFFKRDKKLVLILTFPILLHLIASAFRIYPFWERMLVYLAPIIILFVALGAEKIIASLNPKWKWNYIIPAVLLIGPFFNSISQVIDQERFGEYKNWHQREVYLHINKNFQPGDAVYVHWNALIPYRYYKNIYDLQFTAFEGIDHRSSSKNLNEYINKRQSDFQKFSSYKRVWLVYAKRLGKKIGDAEDKPAWFYKSDEHLKLIPDHFAKIGEQIDQIETKESIYVHLYEISN